MLKRRIIPIELLADRRLVKTISFQAPRDVGDPVKSSRVYSDQDADELILLNISRGQRNLKHMIQLVAQISRECFVPLTVGGGIQSLDDAAELFATGADKVLINSAAYKNIDLVSKIGDRYGQQAVVVGIDVSFDGQSFKLFSDCGSVQHSVLLDDHIKTVIDAGAAEIMIQSIDRDGSMAGYDLNLIQAVVASSSVPVIIAGGAGDFMHLKQAFDMGVDAVACGSLFNFGDNNPLRAKSFLKNYEIPLKKI